MLATGVSSSSNNCVRLLDEYLLESDIVMVATVVSRSRIHHGHYSATFQIEKLVHNKFSYDLNSKYIRLELESGGGGLQGLKRYNMCSSSKVKPNSQYLVMVRKQQTSQKSPNQYSIVGKPIKYRKKYLNQVKKFFCQDCNEKSWLRVRRGKSEGESSDSHTNTRLSCSARGNPPPTLYWTMDGKIIQNSATTRIISKNLSKFLRKSILKLKPSVANRSVKLQCHAYNQYGFASQLKLTKQKYSKSKPKKKIRNLRTHLGLVSDLNRLQYSHTKQNTNKKTDFLLGSHQSQDRSVRHRTATEQIGGVKKLSQNVGVKKLSPLASSSCPISEYCLNGGTCQYYSTIGEQTCHCSHGYYGLRCERKYVDTATAAVMSRLSDKFPLCILGMAHYPCN